MRIHTVRIAAAEVELVVRLGQAIRVGEHIQTDLSTAHRHTQGKAQRIAQHTGCRKIVTNEFGHYFEQKTFKDYYDRLLKDADIGHFTFHALRHTFATRALERDKMDICSGCSIASL
ncbi:MAG: tyrosine-type recombinase/integrase [Oscillospiraceae bacterium]|nr:tyrosine-type recombinase/integrase [Oscillospiraceae bacterium]